MPTNYVRKSRPGFYVYHDLWSGFVDDMTDRQLGQLFRLLYDFSTGQEIEEISDDYVRAAFKIARRLILRDAEAYKATSDARRPKHGSKDDKNAVVDPCLLQYGDGYQKAEQVRNIARLKLQVCDKET